MIKNIPVKIIILTAILLDIILFILFGSGITIIINYNFIEALQMFGYCTIYNIIAIIGIEIILFNFIDIYLSKRKFTYEVEAICVGNDPLPFEREDSESYLTSWSYKYNNTLYLVKNTVSTNIDMPRIGSIRKIYIDPQEPGKKYYDPIFTKKVLPMLIIMAIACLYFYSAILNIGLMKL